MTSEPSAALRPAIALMRRGDIPGARAALDQALEVDPGARDAREFAGLLAARVGDTEAVITHNRALLEADPDSLPARVNLATALAGAGRREEAVALIAGRPEPKLRRLAGFLHQEEGRLAEAIADYEAVVAAHPDDFQIWNNLGIVRLAANDPKGAAVAFDHAVRLNSDLVPLYLNLSEALGQAGRMRDRQAVMHAAVLRAPDDPGVLMELGLAEAAAGDPQAAEEAFRTLIRMKPDDPGAYIELGILYETSNKLAGLDRLVADAERAGVSEGEITFLRAWSLRRRGETEAALAEAERIPETIRTLRRAQLLGDLYDRAGRSEEAFRAFEAMNVGAVESSPPAPDRSYREGVMANAALLTPAQVARWTPTAAERTPPAPVFLVGFPRSGTTLLDTMLMNLPRLHVLEELPVFGEATAALGNDDSRLTALSEAEIAAMRALYFERLAEISPAKSGQLIVDKHPLQMARVAAIHRIFPDARFILAERHPCDAVLSCFMANFKLNPAMRSFTDLEEAARTYDAVFGLWTRATDVLPIDHIAIRYETLIADPEAETRRLLEFLGEPWTPEVMDNRASAAKRGQIRTASYSQVAEPLYTRAVARWTRYRDQLAPVMPILRPWAERMGYPV